MKSALLLALLGAVVAAVCSSWIPSAEVDVEPYDININNIVFSLHVRNNTQVLCRIYVDKPKSLQDCLFGSKDKTIIQVPGFLQKCTGDPEQIPKDAYLSIGDYNVFCLDYSGILPSPNPINNANNVAVILDKLIDFLVAEGQVKVEELHLVCHSLGGQICGLSGYTPGRITALDPAGAEFDSVGPEERLNTSSATYVDVIHTNAGGNGFNRSLGHADFWPNGGKSQLGCGADLLGFCSHFKGYEYFGNTIRNQSLYSVLQCDNDEQAMASACKNQTNAVMGQDAINRTPPGIYWLYLEPEPSN